MKAVQPIRIRNRARPYRLITRKTTRYIAVKLRGGRQRSTKETEISLARCFAYKLIAETRPDLAQELGIEVTPNLKGFASSALSPQPSALSPQP